MLMVLVLGVENTIQWKIMEFNIWLPLTIVFIIDKSKFLYALTYKMSEHIKKSFIQPTEVLH